MIISLADALAFGEKNNCGILAVNTPSLELLLAAIDVAEKKDVPIILQHAEVHEPVNKIEDIGPAMIELAKRSPAKFVVHVDHAETVDYIRRGFEIGFNSAMYDGSALPYEENVAETKNAVALAEEYGGLGIEGELGIMPGREDGRSAGAAPSDPDALYTDPALAEEFVKQTGVTALACSFGTVHGLYDAEPNLKFDLITELRQRSGVPIVMHGGSGLSAHEYRESISRGVRKINYYTYADKAALERAKRILDGEPSTYVFADLTVAARQGAEENLRTVADIIYNA